MAKTLKKKAYRKKQTYRKKAKKQNKRKTHRKNGGEGKRKAEVEYGQGEPDDERERKRVMSEEEKIEQRIEKYKERVGNYPRYYEIYNTKNIDDLEREIEQHKNDDAQWFDHGRGNPTPEEMDDFIVLKLLESLLEVYEQREPLNQMEYFNQADQFSEPEGPDWREIKNNHIKEIEAMLKEHNADL